MAQSARAAAQPPRRVLLTNDDGPDAAGSPFLRHWIEHVQRVLKWNCCVCIPANGQSFVSKSISRGPVKLHRRAEDHYEIEGSPATCVNIALHHLASDCDFVVAGPNVGHNLGRGSVLSSGTVGAAMEGAVAGRRAVALSFPFFNGWNNWTDSEIEAAIATSGRVLQSLWQDWPDAGSADHVELYNVNARSFHLSSYCMVPLGRRELEAIIEQELKMTTVCSASQYSSLYELNEETGQYEWRPRGLRVFETVSPEPRSDVSAVRDGHVSITPLRTAFLGP